MGITVLLADSVVGVRQIERNLLEQEPDIEIVGEAADEPEAMMLIKSVEPQIVVTDFNVRSTGKIFARTKVLGVTELKGKYVKNFVKIFRAEPGFLPFGRRRVLPGSSPRAWRIVGATFTLAGESDLLNPTRNHLGVYSASGYLGPQTGEHQGRGFNYPDGVNC